MTEPQNQAPQDQAPENPASGAPQPAPKPEAGRHRLALAAVLVAAIGVGAGATAIAQKGRSVTLVALAPAPVTAMTDGAMIAVKGEVAETFGNKFILQDRSGRALVETGRRGEDGKLVAKGEEVTVQGRFAHGFVHAIAITHKGDRTDALDPPPPPRHAPGPGGPPA